jgi:saccharopine dehydrogenase-like NADP-dependent oxidoreductase
MLCLQDFPTKIFFSCMHRGSKRLEECKETCYTYSYVVGGEELIIPLGTGTSSAITTEFLARGEIKVRGVIPPEWLEPESILSMQAKLNEICSGARESGDRYEKRYIENAFHSRIHAHWQA